ncbi:hypothetical protein CRE_05751 [Caenorhabditis remanei]|nr:hypothetical protein CRE_05751 [Caenorhabditis remanei]
MDKDCVLEHMDLVTIKEHLAYCHPLVKAKGFSYLADKILRNNFYSDDKKAADHRVVLFDCFCDYGDVALELLLELLPTLKERVMPREEIMEEFSLRLSRMGDKLQRAYPIVLDTCLPPFSKFLELASRIDSDIMTNMFIGDGLQREHYRYITILLFSGLLNENQKRLLGNMGLVQDLFLNHFPHLYPIDKKSVYDPETFLRECPTEELEQSLLQNLDNFQKLHLMNERPLALRNPNLGRHVIFMPFMFLMLQYVPAVSKVLAKKYEVQLKNLREQFQECRDQIQFVEPHFYKDVLTFELFLSHVVTKKNIGAFATFLEYCFDEMTMFLKAHFVPGLTALLPHISDDPILQKRVVRLIVRFLKKAPEHADSFVLYFAGSIGKDGHSVSKDLVMDTLMSLILNTFTLSPITSFMGMLTDSKGDHRVKAYDCITKIVTMHRSAVRVAFKHLRLDNKDPEEIFYANMMMAKECCIAIEENDDLLKEISEFLKDNGYRLAAAIDAAIDLYKHDVVEMKSVRLMVGERVKYVGNQAACASYCRLLGLGATQHEDDDDVTFEGLKEIFIEELYGFTKHSNNDIASAAWTSLGNYTMDDIARVTELTSAQYGEEFVKGGGDHQLGFIEFLRKHLSVEKESYQRPLYNTTVQTDLPPLLSKIDAYKDHLAVKNKDKAWFWPATLPLSASIFQLVAPSNKAQTVVRFLKSCLMNVPPAEDHPGMLRLIAGWRICVREALNALSESKNNDILWARDQICNEGRISLTQKSESVDCIMMMLTVLVDVIEEKLRSLDDQKKVEELTENQKPWILSVLEFVATRLPKEIKEKREPKVNPIYQVITHSNKSSLFTAIFCTRLLYHNTTISDFYRDEAKLRLPEDKMFKYLLHNSSEKLEEGDVPDRNMLWITAEAYGVDILAARAFEVEHQAMVDKKTEKYVEPSLESSADIDLFFKSLLVSSMSQSIKLQNKNRKALENFWINGTEDVKIKIYKGLSNFALSNPAGRKKTTVPVEKLADSSVLKGIVKQFDIKRKVNPTILRPLIKTLVNHKRTDGRFLPPIDWMKLLEKAEWKKATDDIRLALVTLACEQKIPDILFHFVGEFTPQELYVIADNFRTVMQLVPRKEMLIILRQMTRQARKIDEDEENISKIVNIIVDNEKDPIVHFFLKEDLPTLESTIDAADPVLNALKEPNAFVGLISTNYDVWIEAHNGENMNMKRICDVINKEHSSLRQYQMFSLLSLETRKLSLSKRIDKILDMITASRISRNESAELGNYFPIYLALIVSVNAEVDIPVCFFKNEAEFVPMACAARKPFFRALLKCKEMRPVAKHIGEFLRMYVDGDESEFYESWQKTAAADMLRDLLANFGADALPKMFHEDDFFWQSILPVE